jgi:hypothetical protein
VTLVLQKTAGTQSPLKNCTKLTKWIQSDSHLKLLKLHGSDPGVEIFFHYAQNSRPGLCPVLPATPVFRKIMLNAKNKKANWPYKHIFAKQQLALFFVLVF